MTLIARQETLRRIEECDRMPSMPQVIIKIKEISENPLSSIDELANVILTDHFLTTKLLKVANSAFYAEYTNKVSTISQAISLMGFRTVQNTVYSVALYESVRGMGEHKRFDFHYFWSHSLSTGIIGKLLAVASHYRSPEEAFVAGFLHNIGVAVLANVFPEEYEIVLKKMAEGSDHVQAERSVFGVDHTEVGGWIARKWNLPPTLARTLTDHHRLRLPMKQHSQYVLSDIIYLSDLAFKALYDASGKEGDFRTAYARGAANFLGLKSQHAEEILDQAPAMIREIAAELEVPLQTVDRFAPKSVEKTGSKSTSAAIQQTVHSRNELAAFEKVGEVIRAGETEEKILKTMVEELLQSVGIERLFLLRIFPDSLKVSGLAAFGANTRGPFFELGMLTSQGIVAESKLEGESAKIVDVTPAIYQTFVTDEVCHLISTGYFAALPFEIEDDSIDLRAT
jgi:HD-like signal output (HDOD) protein